MNRVEPGWGCRRAVDPRGSAQVRVVKRRTAVAAKSSCLRVCVSWTVGQWQMANGL